VLFLRSIGGHELIMGEVRRRPFGARIERKAGYSFLAMMALYAANFLT
jgi:hypothetical protein